MKVSRRGNYVWIVVSTGDADGYSTEIMRIKSEMKRPLAAAVSSGNRNQERRKSYCCVLAAARFATFTFSGILSAGSGGCTSVSMYPSTFGAWSLQTPKNPH